MQQNCPIYGCARFPPCGNQIVGLAWLRLRVPAAVSRPSVISMVPESPCHKDQCLIVLVSTCVPLRLTLGKLNGWGRDPLRKRFKYPSDDRPFQFQGPSTSRLVNCLGVSQIPWHDGYLIPITCLLFQGSQRRHKCRRPIETSSSISSNSRSTSQATQTQPTIPFLELGISHVG